MAAREAVVWVDLSRPIMVLGRECSRLGLCETQAGDFRGGVRVANLLGMSGRVLGDGDDVDVSPFQVDWDSWLLFLPRIAVDERGKSPTGNDVARIAGADLTAIWEAALPLLLPGAGTPTPTGTP